MRSVTCISFLLLLLWTHPANTMRYHSLENTLGPNYTHLLLDTNLTVLNPSSLIQSRDFTEIFVWDSDTIFVGAANYLLKINADFVIDRTFSVDYTGDTCTSATNTYLDSCGNYFRVFLNITNNLYTCYTNRVSNPVCVTLNPDTLAVESSPPMFDQASAVEKGFISPSLPARLYQRNFAIYLTDINDNPRLVTGSVYDGRERNRITVTDPFTTTYITTTFYYFEEDATIRRFLAAASFSRTAHNYLDAPNSHNYIYFMFYEPSDKLLSGTAISRVGRFCLEGPSDPDSTVHTNMELPQMETFLKGELQCGDVYPSLVQDWLYVETGGEFYYYAVFSSLEKGPRTSYLCVYDLATIRAAMDLVKTCNDNPVLSLLTAIPPMAGSPVVGHSGGLYSQLQRYTFDYNNVIYEMIYISLTDGSVLKYCINCVTQLVEVIQVVPSPVIDANPDLSYIDRLQLNEDHLLAGGYTGLYKVPLQTCTSLGEDYILCGGDPMCYYNSSSNLCLTVTPSTPVPSNSILHLNGTLPVATCSNLTGYITVDRIARTTNISLSWTCATADNIDITVAYLNGSTDTIVTNGLGSGSSTVDLTNIDLNTTLIDLIYIKPFLTHNTIPRALPGTKLYTNATYTVIQEVITPDSCNPVPPICSPPVCVDESNCRTFCSAVTIDCNQSIINTCTQEIRFSIDGGTQITAPTNRIIPVAHGACGARGCLFQSYSYNSDTNETTAGTSHWLNLLRPLNQYTPVISAERTSTVNQYTFSAAFSEFNSHTCTTPVLTINPSSPVTLTSCNQDITALWASSFGTSNTDSERVYSSQTVLAPTNVQLNFSRTGRNDECSYIADVIVSWDRPNYAITNAAQAIYIIEGTACNGNVTDGTSYTCSDVTISYNTMYTVSVTSLEPCFNRVGAVANTSKVSGMSSLPAAPSGLGYTFSEEYLTLTWTPPLCTPRNGPTGYRVVVRRGHCGNFSQTATTSIETTNDPFLQIPLVGLQIYEYNITLQSVTNGMFSETVDLTVFTPVTSDFNCVDCRVQRVRINQDTNVVTCETTPICSNVTTNIRTNFILNKGSSTSTLLSESGGCAGLQYDLTGRLITSGLYTISVRHDLKHDCSDAECTTEASKAFYYYSPTADPTPTAIPSEICQDEKAYIILALAVIAIACAIGNFGFMLVAFCVFCIPRRKVFRCC